MRENHVCQKGSGYTHPLPCKEEGGYYLQVGILAIEISSQDETVRLQINSEERDISANEPIYLESGRG